MAKVLEFQLQHESFQWTPRTDLLWDELVGSPCSPRESQESSPAPQFKSSNPFFFSFIFISWRLITLQYCSGLCHTLTWISHGFTCIPHPDPPSHLFLYPVPLSLPSAPTILRRSAFFIIQLSHPYMTTGKTIALTRWAFVGKIMSLFFNTLSWLVITFLPRRQCLLISWLQSPSAVILEPQKSKALDLSEIVLKSGLPSWNSVTHRCY